MALPLEAYFEKEQIKHAPHTADMKPWVRGFSTLVPSRAHRCCYLEARKSCLNICPPYPKPLSYRILVLQLEKYISVFH